MKTNIIKRSTVLICLLSVLPVLTSCAGFTGLKMTAEAGKASINGKQVAVQSMGNPETDCLVYGYANMMWSLHMYVQTDSSKEAIYTTPLLMGNGPFCFPPFAKDLSFQLVQIRQDGAYVIRTYTPGLGKRGAITFTTQKAGLQFIGAYNLTFQSHTATITPYPRSEQSAYELKTLIKMKAQFKNTEWEPLIDQRIEEIENEKE